MVLVIISGIAEVIKKGGFGYSDMMNIPFNTVMTYCLVMFIGYPIARRIARFRTAELSQAGPKVVKLNPA